jgi:hypothetical protein
MPQAQKLACIAYFSTLRMSFHAKKAFCTFHGSA